MQHDHNQEKLNCDLLTLRSVGGGRGDAGKKNATMLLFFVIPYNLLFPDRLYTE